MKRILPVFALLLMSVAAQARPPENPDPTLRPWFEDLRQPGSGISCCSISDCRPTDYRVAGDHYEAFIEGHWLVVPADRVLHRTDNPTGHAVVCWTPQLGIMCFVQGPEI
jgi:hypothetical protein